MKLKRKNNLVLNMLMVMIFCFGFFACANRHVNRPSQGLEEARGEETRQKDNATTYRSVEDVEEETVLIEENLPVRRGKIEDIHFNFDKYRIEPEARKILKDNYEIIRSLQNPKVLIEGHCDEKGTVEYNLALGQRRSKATLDFLVGLGMEPSQISIISYGEEMPLDPRHEESAWEKNRRAHIQVLSPAR